MLLSQKNDELVSSTRVCSQRSNICPHLAWISSKCFIFLELGGVFQDKLSLYGLLKDYRHKCLKSQTAGNEVKRKHLLLFFRNR